MYSENFGKNILSSSITSVTSFGFWILCNDKEYFVSFGDYPEFKNANVVSIFNVEQLSPNQLRWHDLDIDIELDALENPSAFPMVFKD